MKKVVLACLVAGAIAAPSAFAVSTVKFADGPGSTAGGEFIVTTSDNGTFSTFCLEYNEHIQLGVQYYYQVSQEAKYNGTTSTTDPLSKATAWLYLQFTEGKLAGINSAGDTLLSGYYSSLTNEDPDHLQKAIWFLEGETGGVNNAYAKLAVATAGTGDNNGFYGVGVMNVWGTYNAATGVYGDKKQDQLIRVPDGGSTLALMGLSMALVAFASRRSRR